MFKKFCILCGLALLTSVMELVIILVLLPIFWKVIIMTKKKNADVDCSEKNCPKRKKIDWPVSEQPKRLGLLGRLLKFLFPSRYQWFPQRWYIYCGAVLDFGTELFYIYFILKTIMQEKIPLKYDTLISIEEVMAKNPDPLIIDYIKELHSLILYQRTLIKDQRADIVATKHKSAWTHYSTKEHP